MTTPEDEKVMDMCQARAVKAGLSLLEIAAGGKQVYTNFSHRLDEEVARHLKENKGKTGIHPAWNFFGTIWWDGERWFEAIERHKTHVETLVGDDIMDVIRQANEKYGSD